MDTVNLHDLSTIHLCEHLLSKLQFKHLHLYEINDGSASQTILKDTPLPVLDDLPKNILHLAFFLVENDCEIPQIMNPANAIPTSGNYVTSVMELEMYFWSNSHHNSGYTLVHTMQLVLNALPTTTKLCYCTSQGHFVTIPTSLFSVVEVPIMVLTNTYICNMKLIGRSESDGLTCAGLAQHTMGESGSFPWVYILFRGDGIANAEQKRL